MKKTQLFWVSLWLCIPLLAFSQEWTAKTGLESNARHHPVTWSINGYGYAVTGATATQSGTKGFFKYDPAADSWEQLPDFPGPARSYSIGGVYNGEGYLAFGASGSARYNDLWKYNPTTEEWTQLASCPCVARQHPTFTVNEEFGKIYAGKGNSSSNLRDWWEYDIATDTWTQMENFPGTARHHPYHFSIGEYSYTGLGHDGGSTMAREDLYRFDPATGTWEQMADAPGMRIAGTQFAYEGYGFVLSGDGMHHMPSDPSIFWKYDPSTNTWEVLNPHPGYSLWAPGSFIIDGMLFFVGGVDRSDFTEDFFEGMWATDLNLITMGTQDFNQIAVNIYPNPTSDILNIQLNNGSVKNTVSIVDLAGRMIWKKDFNSSNFSIPVENLNKGIYIVTLTDEKGNHLSSKFIKK